MAVADPYGNYYTASSGTVPYKPGGLINVAGSGTAMTVGGGGMTWQVAPNWNVLSNPEIVDALLTKMVTLYKPEDPLVICVDYEFTQEQLREMRDVLHERGLNATIIAGARAGTGPVIYRPVKEKHERIDILARLAETWERKPQLNLTELLAWWNGENMSDDDFAAATEVYFNKIYEDYT